MRRGDENPPSAGAAAPWTRGALVSLWLIAFGVVGGALAVRWDSLIAGLAAAPQAQQGAPQR